MQTSNPGSHAAAAPLSEPLAARRWASTNDIVDFTYYAEERRVRPANDRQKRAPNLLEVSPPYRD